MDYSVKIYTKRDMTKERRTIRNIGSIFRAKVIEPEIEDGKRCKCCHQPIRDETKWYNGPQLCQGCKDAMEYGIAWH